MYASTYMELVILYWISVVLNYDYCCFRS